MNYDIFHDLLYIFLGSVFFTHYPLIYSRLESLGMAEKLLMTGMKDADKSDVFYSRFAVLYSLHKIIASPTFERQQTTYMFFPLFVVLYS